MVRLTGLRSPVQGTATDAPSGPMRLGRQVTLHDVATECGVSISTVSAVVNDAAWVSDTTRSRVQRVIARLGYRPNQLARGLRVQQSYAIGVIASDLTNPFIGEVVRTLSHALREDERALCVCDSDHRFELGQSNLRLLLDGQVAGLVLIGDTVTGESLRRYVRETRIPVVAIEAPSDIPDASYLLVDSERGGYAGTWHLIEQGYRHIAMIGGPQAGPGSTVYAREQRFLGYCRALDDAGLPHDPSLMVEGDFRFEGGRQAMHRLLQRSTRPEAVFAANDVMALGAMQALRESGLRVPEDVALVGFDDIPMVALTTPGLTTLRNPARGLGTAAAALLREQIPLRGRHTVVRQMFDAELVVRGSSSGHG